MRVVEIFESIEGEGVRAGLPVVFIRLAGCNLRCSYCDTKYSYDATEAKVMPVHDVVKTVGKYRNKNITITGGEPLIHKDVCELIEQLLKQDCWVNVETNGTVDVVPIREGCCKQLGKLFFTMDYKCPSSNAETIASVVNASKLYAHDVLKFVVGCTQDIDRAEEVIEAIKPKAAVYLSPVFGEIEPVEIVEEVLKRPVLKSCRVQLQLHKMIWPVDMRGV